MQWGWGSRCRANAVQCHNALQWLCDTSLAEFPCGTGGMFLGIRIPEATTPTELMIVHSFLTWPLVTTAHFDHLIVVVTSPNGLTLLGLSTGVMSLINPWMEEKESLDEGSLTPFIRLVVSHTSNSPTKGTSRGFGHFATDWQLQAFWCQKSFAFQAFILLGTLLIPQLVTTSKWCTNLPKSTQSKDHLAKYIGQCPSKRWGVALAREVWQRHSQKPTDSSTLS